MTITSSGGGITMTLLTPVLLALLVAVLVTLILLALRLQRVKAERDAAVHGQLQLADRFRPVVDVEAERVRVLAAWQTEQAQLHEAAAQAQSASAEALRTLETQRRASEAQVQELGAVTARLRAELAVLDEEATLQSFGFYKPRYDFASSDKYEAHLDQIRDAQKKMLSDKSAAVCRIEWTVNGSKAEGKKQINQTLKLILRAFNGECDAAIAKVKYNNVHVMEARIQKSWEAINGLAEVQQCTITSPYLDLKLQELALAFEYQEKLQAEKEEQRRAREQMREEEVARREIDKARQDAEKEEARYAAALKKAQDEVERVAGAKQQKLLAEIEALQQKLAEAHANKERAVAQAQLTRSGHVYIISNIGSFGEHVYKIGMTRRLVPQDRIDELGDASVPFDFDVHAMIRCEDAPSLENALHREFHLRRMNRVNERKEFFHVSLDEIVDVVNRVHKQEVEVRRFAEAEEYRKTVAMREAEDATRAQRVPPPVPVRALQATL